MMLGRPPVERLCGDDSVGKGCDNNPSAPPARLFTTERLFIVFVLAGVVFGRMSTDFRPRLCPVG